MSEQLHITHRATYLCGVAQGKADAQDGADYRPGVDIDRTGVQRAYGIGYADGWTEGNPCEDGSCGHTQHVAS